MSNTYSSTPSDPINTTPTVGGVGGTTGIGGTTSGTAGTAGTTGTTDTSDTSGTAGTAKEQASHVADKAKDAGGKVLGTAKEETARVAGEAKSQAKDLFAQTKDELVEQAGSQQQRAASGLHTLSDQLQEMATNAPSGVAGDLVGQAASRAGSVASWLEQRDPGTLVDDVRRFAREKPGTFIAIAAGAGLLIGRLTRSVASAGSDDAAPTTGTAPSGGTRVDTTPPDYPVETERVVEVDAALEGDPTYPDARYPGATTVGETRL